MMISGGCHCGAVRYEVSGEPVYEALCHCGDCRRHAGAPMVGWAAFPAGAVRISGAPSVYQSSESGRRLFCGACGTSLFYSNEVALPGLLDIQSGTFDDPGARPPQIHVQTAERLAWMDGIDSLPKFARYPGQD